MLAQHLAKALRPPPTQQKKPLGWAWVPMLYVHRYLRLTPLYFFVVSVLFTMVGLSANCVGAGSETGVRRGGKGQKT